MSWDTHNVKVGKYSVDVISNDEYIRRTLECGYEWDGWMRHDLPRLYKPGTDILDIGGNIGFNSLMFSDYGPVHVFEPLFYPIISKNIKQNNLIHTVTVHPYGLSNVSSENTLIYNCNTTKDGLVNYGGCSLSSEERDLQTATFIKLRKLSDVYNGVPSLLKIDVEGHEWQVILGAKEIIQEHKPSLYVEIFNRDTSPIIPFLENLGYTMYSRPEHNYLFVQ